jgi:4-hydroxy-2-oxoheptanedioate aldolase
LSAGQPAFATFAAADVGTAMLLADQPYDAVVFEMEHNPYDIGLLRDCLQYMLNRRAIAESGSVAPSVAPLVRIPANGGELNQWLAKQVLDAGVYGIVWPHVSTVEEARNAVAACRYPRPPDRPHHQPAGLRGDAPAFAARYWGLSEQEYRRKADVWPLAPEGELLVVIMVEDRAAIDNLPLMLDQVPGIGAVLIGEGDLSADLGHPRQYDHPTVAEAIREVVAICRDKEIVVGHAHVDSGNLESVLEQGYRLLMTSRETTFNALKRGVELTRR